MTALEVEELLKLAKKYNAFELSVGAFSVKLVVEPKFDAINPDLNKEQKLAALQEALKEVTIEDAELESWST